MKIWLVAVSQSIAVHPAGDVIGMSTEPSAFLESNGTGSTRFAWWTIGRLGGRHSRGRSCSMPLWLGKSLMWSTG